MNSSFKRLSLATKRQKKSDYSKTSIVSPVTLRVKGCPVHVMKAYGWSRRKALLNLNLGIKLGHAVNITPQPTLLLIGQ